MKRIDLRACSHYEKKEESMSKREKAANGKDKRSII